VAGSTRSRNPWTLEFGFEFGLVEVEVVFTGEECDHWSRTSGSRRCAGCCDMLDVCAGSDPGLGASVGERSQVRKLRR